MLNDKVAVCLVCVKLIDRIGGCKKATVGERHTAVAVNVKRIYERIPYIVEKCAARKGSEIDSFLDSLKF